MVTDTKIADNAVRTAHIANNQVTAAKIAGSEVVKALNGLKDNVQLTAGSNIAITPSGNQLTIAAQNVVTTGGTGAATVTSSSSAYAVNINNTSGDGATYNLTGAGVTKTFARFQNNGSTVGSITSTSGGNVVYNSGGADYAEWLPRVDASEEIAEGDVVGVFAGKISKRTQGAERVMAISSAPLALGNTPAQDQLHLYEKVGFVGQVPVQVVGAVEAGDYIVVSGREDGTAVAIAPDQMQPNDFVQVIGRAWEGSDELQAKKINVVVGLPANDWARFVGELGQFARAQAAENAELKAQLQQVSVRLTQVEAMELKMARMEAAMARLEALVSTNSDADVATSK